MNKFKRIAVAALLMNAGNAQALTPWDNGVPNLTIRISGAVAQNKAYTQVVTDILAASGTLDTFNDVARVGWISVSVIHQRSLLRCMTLTLMHPTMLSVIMLVKLTKAQTPLL